MNIAKKVTLKGTAENAKGGAVLVAPDNKVVYIEGLSSWPDDVFRKTVEVTGFLVTKKSIPDPVNDKGEICQGAWGQQLVLEQPKWRILEK